MFSEIAHRVTYPLLSLAEGGLWKSILSALGALIASDMQLVLLVVILVLIDFLSGIFAAWRRGEEIRSWGFRQTGIKAIEFTILLFCCTMVANSFPIVSWLSTSAYLFVALTEIKSIFENALNPQGGAYKAWAMIRDELDDRTKIAQETNDGLS